MNLYTTQTAAQSLGVSQRRVLALISAGRLKATKVGPLWTIRPADLDKVRSRKNGRPRKEGKK